MSVSPAIRAAQLISGSTGWALSTNALSMTSDGGLTWTSITPPGVPVGDIRGAYFMDPQHGWVVSDSPANPEQLEFSVTTDGGTSWSTSPLGSPGPFDSALPYYVDFTDIQHGWVVAMVSANATAFTGFLLVTSDGGMTWQRLQMPVGGPVEFVSPTSGWLADGRQGDKLYVTTDAGQTWSAAAPVPPSGFTPNQASYTIPAFTSPTNVILAAFNNGTSSAAGFYQTPDGGASWQLAASVPARSPAGGAVSPLAALATSSAWFAVAIDGTSVTDVTNGGASQASTSPAGLPSSAYSDASFTSTGHGWLISDQTPCTGFKSGCTETIALYGTSDSGAHWTLLNVP